MRANAVAAKKKKKKTETTTVAESEVDQVFPPAEAVAAADPMPTTTKRVTTPESNLAHLRQRILHWKMQCARRQRYWNRQLWQWMWH
jgi:hypothetical protein